MAELALDDVERDALLGHLDRVSMAQLMRGKAAAYTGLGSEPPQLTADGAGGPRPPAEGPSTTQNSAPTGIMARRVCQGRSCSQPQWSMPTSRRLSPLPWRTSSARLLLHGKERLVFERSLELARETRPAEEATEQILDSTPMLGAAAVQDTVSLVRAGVRKLIDAVRAANCEASGGQELLGGGSKIVGHAGTAALP